MKAEGKPRWMPAETYQKRIKDLVALKDALDEAGCVEMYDVGLNKAGDIAGRVGLLHDRPFVEFNEILIDHPVDMIAIHSSDRITNESPEGHVTFSKTVKIRVLIAQS